MEDSERVAVAAHLHVVLRRKTGRVTDTEWMACNLEYATEIIRAGLQATPRGQLEAADSLAFTRWQIFLHVMLRPALRKVWPALSSQVVITMLGSSVCSQISTEELTFVANFNAFDLVYSMQGALAGPDKSTDILGTFLYRTFFGFQLQLGDPSMGATIATIMFLIILTGVCIYLFGIQRRIRRYQF